ncbi:MAG: hypothetical protein LQ337_002332 [Flavoplaca oasis]|nr:MAG: hypothetical protein LQ337_002332 [Flavoplaca oasis]
MFYLALPLVLLLSLVAEAVVIPPTIEPAIAALVLAYEADPAGFLEAQGNRQLDINVCPTFGGCSADGLALWKELEEIKINPAHQDIPSSRSTFIQDYSHTPTGSDPWLSKDFKNDLVGIGVDLTRLIMWSVSSISAELGLGRWAYTNLFDTNAGAIVGVWNARDLDFKQSLPWSEIVYQTWQLAQATQTNAARTYAKGYWLPGDPISNLKHSIQYQVDNPETIDILDSIYVNNQILARVDREWRVWTDDDPRTKNWFFGLVGTDSCKGTLELLKNHAVEIGRKEITEIRTRWWGEKPDIWYVPFLLSILLESILCKTGPSLPIIILPLGKKPSN